MIPLAHIAGMPVEETIASLGPALLVTFGAASATLRTRLRRARSSARQEAARKTGPRRARTARQRDTARPSPGPGAGTAEHLRRPIPAVARQNQPRRPAHIRAATEKHAPPRPLRRFRNARHAEPRNTSSDPEPCLGTGARADDREVERDRSHRVMAALRQRAPSGAQRPCSESERCAHGNHRRAASVDGVLSASRDEVR